MDSLEKHGLDLIMHNEIISLFDVCFRSGKINPKRTRLMSRKLFIEKVEEDFKTIGLKPTHKTVQLSDGSVACRCTA